MELRGQCPICFFTLVTSPTRGSTQPGVEGSQTQHTFFNSSHDSDSKESACNAGDLGSIPELGKCPGEGKGYLLQYSGLEVSMDCIVHGVAKSQAQLSDFYFQKNKNFCMNKNARFEMVFENMLRFYNIII